MAIPSTTAHVEMIYRCGGFTCPFGPDGAVWAFIMTVWWTLLQDSTDTTSGRGKVYQSTSARIQASLVLHDSCR